MSALRANAVVNKKAIGVVEDGLGDVAEAEAVNLDTLLAEDEAKRAAATRAPASPKSAKSSASGRGAKSPKAKPASSQKASAAKEAAKEEKVRQSGGGKRPAKLDWASARNESPEAPRTPKESDEEARCREWIDACAKRGEWARVMSSIIRVSGVDDRAAWKWAQGAPASKKDVHALVEACSMLIELEKDEDAALAANVAEEEAPKRKGLFALSAVPEKSKEKKVYHISGAVGDYSSSKGDVVFVRVAGRILRWYTKDIVENRADRKKLGDIEVEKAYSDAVRVADAVDKEIVPFVFDVRIPKRPVIFDQPTLAMWNGGFWHSRGGMLFGEKLSHDKLVEVANQRKQNAQREGFNTGEGYTRTFSAQVGNERVVFERGVAQLPNTLWVVYYKFHDEEDLDRVAGMIAHIEASLPSACTKARDGVFVAAGTMLPVFETANVRVVIEIGDDALWVMDENCVREMVSEAPGYQRIAYERKNRGGQQTGKSGSGASASGARASDAV